METMMHDMIQNAKKAQNKRKAKENLNYSKCIPELKGIHNTQLPPQASKGYLIEGLGQDIC